MAIHPSIQYFLNQFYNNLCKLKLNLFFYSYLGLLPAAYCIDQYPSSLTMKIILAVLNKYFPEDISAIIYNFLQKAHVKDHIESKLIFIENILNSYIEQYKFNLCYDINIDYRNMNLLDQKIMNLQNNYINKYLYSFDERFITILKKYRTTLLRITTSQSCNVYEYANPLSMGKFDIILENTDKVLKISK